MAIVEFLDHGRWAEVVLNRPERRNAIDGPLDEALAAAIECADADDGVQAHTARACRRRVLLRPRPQGLQCRRAPGLDAAFPRHLAGAHTAIRETRTHTTQFGHTRTARPDARPSRPHSGPTRTHTTQFDSDTHHAVRLGHTPRNSTRTHTTQFGRTRTAARTHVPRLPGQVAGRGLGDGRSRLGGDGTV